MMSLKAQVLVPYAAHLAPEAWEQDYHRVGFVIPADGVAYGRTKRKASAQPEAAGEAAAPAAHLRVV